MNLFLPKHVLEWIDANRGQMSRQSFVVHYLKQLVEEKTKDN